MAYRRTSRTLYTGAYFKRHVGFASEGPDAIYQINLNAGLPNASVFLELDTLFGPNTAGPNCHDTTNYDTDYISPCSGGAPLNSWDAVGKIGLGNIEIIEDLNTPTNDTLYVINLFDRQLYKVSIANTAATTRFALPTALPGANQGCNTADVRPGAVSARNGLLYVGLVCSAQTSQLVSDLRAYVYSFNPATNAFSAAPVLEFTLNYSRGCAGDTAGTCSADRSANWLPWATTFTSRALQTNPASTDTTVVYAQPMLTDLVFDKDGSMVLAFRDRAGDQVGNQNLSRPSSTSRLK